MKTVILEVPMSENQFRALEEIAEQRGVSMTSIMHYALKTIIYLQSKLQKSDGTVAAQMYHLWENESTQEITDT